MNRLLLRALPRPGARSRIEVHFQYVQDLDIPMSFASLTVVDVTETERDSVASVPDQFPDLRVYRLTGGHRPGRVVAAGCAFGEDEESASAGSMFPMMG